MTSHSYSALTANSPRDVSFKPQTRNIALTVPSISETPLNPQSLLNPLDVVQFSAAIYIVNVDEGKIQIDVMRIGKMESKISFKYATTESSAVAGVQFESVVGTVSMESGQDSASIEVPILNSGRWNPTTEFCMSLSDPEGCTLGLFLKFARVKVLDSGTFPLNEFKAKVEEGDDGVNSINKFHLFGGFTFQMWQQDGIKWRTIVTILLDQLDNAYAYLKLTLAIYMVDKVFNFDNDAGLFVPGNRLATTNVVAGLIIGPMFVLYLVDLAKIGMDIRGRLQRDLSRNLFRKFMNYNKESREDVPTPDMVASLTQDAGACVDGYLSVLSMVQLAGRLILSIAFTLSQNPSAWWACVLVPALMSGWGYLRTDSYIKASSVTGEMESMLSQFVNAMLNKIQLIADYNQRPQINDLFAGKSEALRQVQIPEHLVVFNNMFFPKVLGPALVALYTAVGGALVLDNKLSLGVYLSTISVFGEICSAFAHFFAKVMDVIAVFDPLVGLTIILNKPTDVPAWKVVSRKRRALTKEFRSEILAALKSRPADPNAPFVPAADKMEIKIQDVTFAYPGGADPVFKGIHFSLPQGKICAVVGKPGRGRRTLLELIAHKMFPDEGTLFVPSHLRILYVSAEPVMLNLSAWQNLAFGNSKNNNPVRIEKILNELQMDDIFHLCQRDLSARKKEMVSHNLSAAGAQEEDEEEEGEEEEEACAVNPLDKLRASQKALMHLARALIMNPEVMVLHRPFMHYPTSGNDQTCELIRKVLTEHVQNRGFLMDPSDRHLRRPRTVFFTAETDEQQQMADLCWMLPDNVGGECVAVPPPTLAASHDRKTASTTASPPQAASRRPLPDFNAMERPLPPDNYARERPLPPEISANDRPMLSNFSAPERAAPLQRDADYMEVDGNWRGDPEKNTWRGETPRSALKQEIMSLGPRPMSSVGMGMLLEQGGRGASPSLGMPAQVPTNRNVWSGRSHEPMLGLDMPPRPQPSNFSAESAVPLAQAHPPEWQRKMPDQDSSRSRRCCGA